MSSLTSANSSFALAVAGVFPAPLPVQGYATDDAFASEPVELVEVAQGVDGELSGGKVYAPNRMTIVIQPNSPSIALFQGWDLYESTVGDVTTASGSISIPAIGQKFLLTKGFLTSRSQMPEAKKILQPMRFVITWKKIIGVPL